MSQSHFPHPERVSETYAEQRIREKIARLAGRERQGIEELADGLRAQGVAPATRLHLVTAVVNLGRISQGTLPRRLADQLDE